MTYICSGLKLFVAAREEPLYCDKLFSIFAEIRSPQKRRSGQRISFYGRPSGKSEPFVRKRHKHCCGTSHGIPPKCKYRFLLPTLLSFGVLKLHIFVRKALKSKKNQLLQRFSPKHMMSVDSCS